VEISNLTNPFHTNPTDIPFVLVLQCKCCIYIYIHLCPMRSTCHTPFVFLGLVIVSGCNISWWALSYVINKCVCIYIHLIQVTGKEFPRIRIWNSLIWFQLGVGERQSGEVTVLSERRLHKNVNKLICDWTYENERLNGTIQAYDAMQWCRNHDINYNLFCSVSLGH
jgi:hypothetical protein